MKSGTHFPPEGTYLDRTTLQEIDRRVVVERIEYLLSLRLSVLYPPHPSPPPSLSLSLDCSDELGDVGRYGRRGV